MISELLAQLPEAPIEEVPPEKGPYAIVMSPARRAMSCNLFGLAKAILQGGRWLIDDEECAGYHLSAARLWWGHCPEDWPEAYCHLLTAEDADPDLEVVQKSLAELETNLAERFKQLPPLGGFFRCVLRKRTDNLPDNTLERQWAGLAKEDPKAPPDRACRRAGLMPLIAVQLIAAARVQGDEMGDMGDIDAARRYLADAGPESRHVLERVAPWIEKFNGFESLQPITERWLEVIGEVMKP